MIDKYITITNTNRVLLSLVLLDIVLLVIGYFFPQFWFKIFHGVEYIDPQGFLPRCAGHWTMFAILQGIALLKWRKDIVWLPIVAGVRFSDMLTDWSYLYFCSDITLFGKMALFGAGPGNFLFGLFLFKAYKQFVADKV